MTHLQPRSRTYDCMGTRWCITVWDSITDEIFGDITTEAISMSEEFDRTYSRFRPDSLVCSIATQTGIIEVPVEFTDMVLLYRKFYECSGGKLTPLIGYSISDAGYDAQYSLVPKEHIRPTPDFEETVRIIDDTHIELAEPVLFDLGALGKGYMVDTLAAYLDAQGLRRFLVDGSGDMVYRNTLNDEPIRVGLEHPSDTTKAIGVFTMTGGALCGSGGNRRAWGEYHHILDPQSLTSPKDIAATWVLAESAALADALATCLFLVSPEKLQKDFIFEYCMMNSEERVKCSDGFRKKAEMFHSA